MMLSSSLDGFNKWRKETPLNRQAILEKTVQILEKNFEENAANLTREMGKPVAEAKIEMQVVLICFAGTVRKENAFTVELFITFPWHATYAKVPVGPSLAFVAWNFPATMSCARLLAHLPRVVL